MTGHLGPILRVILKVSISIAGILMFLYNIAYDPGDNHSTNIRACKVLFVTAYKPDFSKRSTNSLAHPLDAAERRNKHNFLS